MNKFFVLAALAMCGAVAYADNLPPTRTTLEAPVPALDQTIEEPGVAIDASSALEEAGE